MSAACLSLSRNTLKIIDTHDVFGERQYLLQQQKVPPSWFFTSAIEESKGLERANLIIAIQPEEACVLRCRTTRPVVVIGHILPKNFRPLKSTRNSGSLIAGYLASGNPSNRRSLTNLIDEVIKNPQVSDRWSFLIAGEVGKYLPSRTRGFHTLGFIQDLTVFYDTIDVAINPNISGSGLKIKNVEALSFGIPTISTADGMVGIPTSEPAHLCETLQEMLRHLMELTDLAARHRLAQVTRSVFLRYTDDQWDAFRYLLPSSTPQNSVTKNSADVET
jgi:hypothetical protein